MSIDQHVISHLDGSTPIRTDRTLVALVPAVANAAGGGAGASVTTTVSGFKGLPAKFVPVVNPGQDATWYVTNRTSTGFDVVLTPRLAANTLSAGAFDVAIFA